MPTTEELEKHSVRLRDWLPVCRRRLEDKVRVDGANAYIRYFTYSSGDNLDPIFLFNANVIGLRTEGGVDRNQGLTSVHLFNRLADNPQYTSLDLPGARCFGGSFVKTILVDPDTPSPFDPDSDDHNKYSVLQASHRRFRQYFPFDLVNIDWNDLLIDSGPQPTLAMQALGRLFEWQALGGDDTPSISAFALSLSCRRPAPVDVSPDGRAVFRDVISANLARAPHLESTLSSRFKVNNADDLAQDHWDQFVDLGTVKMILSALLESGWVVDPNRTPHFVARQADDGSVICQLIMEVIRVEEGERQSRYATSVDHAFNSVASQVDPSSLGSARNSFIDVVQLRTSFREGPSRL